VRQEGVPMTTLMQAAPVLALALPLAAALLLRK
jgi:hypothetical protein